MNRNIKELIKLTTENPDLEVITMVDYEVCAGDDYTWWRGYINSVEKDFYYIADDEERYIL